MRACAVLVYSKVGRGFGRQARRARGWAGGGVVLDVGRGGSVAKKTGEEPPLRSDQWEQQRGRGRVRGTGQG